MRLPKLTLPRARSFRLPGFDLRGPLALGSGSVASLLKVALDVAYVLLMLATVVALALFVAAIFVPVSNYTIVSDDSGTQQPLTQPLVLFGLGAFSAWFGGFLLILRNLRMIFRSLTIRDPFQPENVARVRSIGFTLATVTAGIWIAQSMVAAHLAPGVMDPPGVGELLTPIFSVLVVFVLAEVFREGARLRRESELTI
jgi:hypothetical protein